MTLDEFLAWALGDRSVRGWQLVDGDPVAMAPASDAHGALQSEIARLLGNHLAVRNSACRVITEPGIVPHVRADWNYRVPDLGVTCAPPPVLLIEILSPGNEADTRANVWAYTTLPSVQEILLVRSTRMEAELLRRQADGSWPAAPLIRSGHDLVEVASIDYAEALSAFYRTTGLQLR
jgi:Uma2 family endonuclease